MTGWLLDTNVLSELRRPKPDAKVVQFISSHRAKRSLRQTLDARIGREVRRLYGPHCDRMVENVFARLLSDETGP